MIARLLALLLALLAVPALAAPVTLASPDGRTVVSVANDDNGRVLWSLARDGKPLIAASRLGFLLIDQPKLERFAIGDVARNEANGRWELPWGERRFVTDHFRAMTVALTDKSGRRMDIEFRAYDQGVGFRYRFPDQPKLKTINIADELTEFNFARTATAWPIKAYDWNREEQLYHKVPLAEVGLAQTPFTLRFDDGTHMSIHEAALVDFPAMNLAHVEGLDFKALLTPSNRGAKATVGAPFATPWRVLMIADSAPALYNASDLILNLNAPNKLGDVSWVKPCKYAGIWWGMHLGVQSWNSGPIHGATTANALKMIDWAKANGLCGLLIEGWNKGWDGEWFGNGDFSFTEPYPDFDLPRIAAYARAQGIRLIGHHETGGNIAHYEAQMGAGFDLYRRLGIDMVKTGYVADAGGIRAKGPDGAELFTWHESQDAVRHHLLVVTEAAKRHIAIDAHEPVKDTGLRRTYPNWVSREDARGQEYNAWGNPDNPPEHESTLFYTRMLSGPMDFTPGVLSLRGKNGQVIRSTIAKQLALYVVLYSPIQMAADLPQHYAEFPKAFQFIKDVAVDWEDSRALMGEVGDYAVIARKAKRPGGEWFLGATGGAAARDIRVPLDFLEGGVRYRAEIYRDGPKAGWKADPFDLVIETRAVTRADALALRLGVGGGAAVRFVPERR